MAPQTGVMVQCPHLKKYEAWISPPNRPEIYREECTLCFDSTEDGDGIATCLDCFNAGCMNDPHHHAKKHSSVALHPVALHIVKKLKPESMRKKKKLMKLAIEVEDESENFVISTSFTCFQCSKKDMPITPETESIVDYILKSQSSERHFDIQPWEQQIEPCSHSLSLEQQDSLLQRNWSHIQCAKCDQDKNLWVCLTCSHIGCGRAQYGGIAGNSHGLTHFEESGHPISVKFGSITPSGEADVYCYICNDEVRDPNLKSHLAYLGIDVSKQTKDEKSLAELQLEQNKNWEFLSINEDGSELERIQGPGLVGLKNLGNFCYISSVVQAIFNIEAFRERFTSARQNEDNENNPKPSESLTCQLSKIANGLESERYSQLRNEDSAPTYPCGLALRTFKNLIGRGHLEFSSARQQDAFEFYEHLMDCIKAQVRLKDSTGNPQSLFSFVIEERLQCSKCSRVKYRQEERDSITVPIPVSNDSTSASSLLNCLEKFSARETLKYHCGHCDDQTELIKSTKFKTFPNILVINIQRFTVANGQFEKVNHRIELPKDELLVLKDFRSIGLQKTEVELEGESMPVVDEGMVSQLESMGFTPEQSRKAVHETNGVNTELAMNWILEFGDSYENSSQARNQKTNSDQLGALIDMGFSRNKAHAALQITNNNIEAAVGWLYENPDFEPKPRETTDSETNEAKHLAGDDCQSPIYKANGIVCHKGSSINVGHYVAFLKKEYSGDQRWVLFNDDRVMKTNNLSECETTSYLYLFTRSNC